MSIILLGVCSQSRCTSAVGARWWLDKKQIKQRLFYVLFRCLYRLNNAAFNLICGCRKEICEQNKCPYSYRVEFNVAGTMKIRAVFSC